MEDKSLSDFVREVAKVKAAARLRKFEEDVMTAAKMEPSYNNPFGELPYEAKQAIKVQLSKAEESFLEEAEAALWKKLYRFLMED